MREYKYIRNTLPISNRTMTLDPFYTRPVFYIDSNEYNFILGMTWDDWVNSSFNTDGFTIDGEWINVGSAVLMDSSANQVKPSYLIKEREKYQKG